MFFVAQPTAEFAGATRINSECELLDDKWEARFGEFCRQVARVRNNVNRVFAIGVVATTCATTQNLTHQVATSIFVFAVYAGVSNRLLIRWHLSVDSFGDNAGQNTEHPQNYEGARIRWRRKDWRDQSSRWREQHLNQWDDALIDVQLRHAFWSVSQIAQDRRQPLFHEHTIGVIRAVIDRTLSLRRGAGEVKDQTLATWIICGGAGQGDALGVQLRFINTIVFGVVFPDPGADWNFAQDFAAVGLGRVIDDRVEGRFDSVFPVAIK